MSYVHIFSLISNTVLDENLLFKYIIMFNKVLQIYLIRKSTKGNSSFKCFFKNEKFQTSKPNKQKSGIK